MDNFQERFIDTWVADCTETVNCHNETNRLLGLQEIGHNRETYVEQGRHFAERFRDLIGFERFQAEFGDIASAEPPVVGVTLNDVANALGDGDEVAAAKTVKRWVDSKKITAKPIGKCPRDGRRSLYRSSEIVPLIADIENLSRRDKERLPKVLAAKEKLPREKAAGPNRKSSRN